jgi:hypothetical protein
MLHADTLYWGSLFDTFADFQVLLCDPGDTLIALGYTISFVWNGTAEDLSTIDEVMERVMEAYRRGHELTALSALAALVSLSIRSGDSAPRSYAPCVRSPLNAAWGPWSRPSAPP